MPSVPRIPAARSRPRGASRRLRSTRRARSITTGQVPDERERERDGDEDQQPRGERAPDRHLQLGGDERGAGQRPRRDERRHAVGIASEGIRLADRRGDETGHEGWREQHAEKRLEDEGRRSSRKTKSKRQLERQQDPDQRRQRPAMPPPLEPRLSAGGRRKTALAGAAGHPRSVRAGRRVRANRARRRGEPARRRSRRRDTRGEAAAPGRPPSPARGLCSWIARRTTASIDDQPQHGDDHTQPGQTVRHPRQRLRPGEKRRGQQCRPDQGHVDSGTASTREKASLPATGSPWPPCHRASASPPARRSSPAA